VEWVAGCSWIQWPDHRGARISIYTSRSFIYEKGQDEAIFNIDPRYDEVVARSGLRHEKGCGIEGAWTGFYLLLQDPKYRR
jgi:hypothetical protein